jgi:hypothetical protein
MHETWKALPGYPGYEASTLGRIRSLLAGTPRIRKPKRLNSGYLWLPLFRGSRSNTGGMTVHRAVLLAFRGECPPGHEAAHHDGDRLNNCLSNLRWKKHVHNEADKERHGTRPNGVRHYDAQLTEDDVRAIRSSTEPLKTLAARHGTTYQNIWCVRHRKSWRHVH